MCFPHNKTILLLVDACSTPSVRADSSPYREVRDASSVVTNYDTEKVHRTAVLASPLDEGKNPRHRPGYDKRPVLTPVT